MLNHIVVMGRLGRDPELRRTQNGTPVASFVLAVDRDYKDKTTGERATDWINIVAWRGTAEFVSRYFTKGRMAVVEGRLQVRNWTDKNEIQRTTAEVVAENVYFGDSPRREGESGSYGAQGGYSGAQGSYGGSQGGYGASQGGYGAPQQGSYGAPPQSSYGAPPQGGYSAPQSGSYGGGSYGAPPADGDAFSELADDDGELPF